MLSALCAACLRLFEEYPLVEPAIIALVSLYVYYQILVIRPVNLHCKSSSPFTKLLKKHMPILTENYKPTIWCFEARLQTVFASLMRRTIPKIEYKREIHKLFDGGEVALDWISPDEEVGDDAPIILFLPGLTGESQSEYIKSFVNIARWRLNARSVVFNFRGRGGHGLKTPRTYCASNSEDLASVVNHIHDTYPDAPVLALGVSLGGIILGNYLAEQGEKAIGLLNAAMMVSVCFDPFKGTESLEKKGLNLMLNRHLANCLVESIQEVQHHFVHSKLWNLDHVYNSKTVKEFDERFTCHQFGYRDCNDYYTHTKIKGKINRIKVPLFALNAEDDPFSPGDSLPVDEAKRSDYFAMLTTSYGGHIGFMEGFWPTRYHFSDRIFEQFAKAVFEEHSSQIES